MALFSFTTQNEMSDAICDIFRNYIAELNRFKKPIFLAFSGGTTPEMFFQKLAARQKNQATATDWSRIHIFWVDERCVPPDHHESNYGMTNHSLLKALNLPKNQVHRIHGEDDPEKEALRYENEIRMVFQEQTGIPVFDWIFLGMGEDGHIASIFPGRLELLESPDLCAVAHHPRSGQSRITITGPLIRNARRISFLVTGENKSGIIRQIIRKEPEAIHYPAFYIRPVNGDMDWYLDSAAAKQLKP